jgi:hypothetical protein
MSRGSFVVVRRHFGVRIPDAAVVRLQDLIRLRSSAGSELGHGSIGR